MNDLSIIPANISPAPPIALPAPRVPINIRVATMDDFPFIDGLQKKYHRQLGFFPRAQMEEYIRSGWMIVAEDAATGAAVGYCASRDRYQKRDELGAIFQLCVDEGCQRNFVGMTLLRHVFDRASYGCRLFCCWCAQDLEANRFWEACGFVPLAFRAGSEKKARVHIFWQKRIRQGDDTTPYWFPCQTNNGSIREDRIVLPIPPGTHWSDAKPMILPGTAGDEASQNEGPTAERLLVRKPRAGKDRLKPPALSALPGLQFGMARKPKAIGERRACEEKKCAKNDPKLVTVARELRDRWLEKVNSGQYLHEAAGKYRVSRQIEAQPTTPADLHSIPLLNAA